MTRPRLDLAEVLPAGEWASVRLLNQPAGMMASRDWAVFAKAKRLRDGGKPAFIKFIIPADSQAGSKTNLVTGPERLERLASRLTAIRAMGDSLPVVRLLEVSLSAPGLLIAMEEITTLQEIIDRGDAYEFSANVLRDLDPSAASVAWMHFDICPRNIGITAAGKAVLIDLESFYLASREGYEISVPAWKSFRAPANLVNEVDAGLVGDVFDRELALRKVRFEVTLAAAECVLGPLPPRRGRELDVEIVDQWVNGADPADPAVAFWTNAARKLLVGRDMRPLTALAEELEAISMAGGGGSMLPNICRSEPQQGVADEQPQVVSAEGPGGWEFEWDLLIPTAHALRAGRLDRQRIEEYRRVLEGLAAKYPQRKEVVDELLLVAICYERDLSRAQQYVKTARARGIESPHIVRTGLILANWASDKRK